MRHYFYDLYCHDELIIDGDGVAHFDEGSALYYGRSIADRIARDRDHAGVKVHVLTDEGALLAVLTSSQAVRTASACGRRAGHTAMPHRMAA